MGQLQVLEVRENANLGRDADEGVVGQFEPAQAGANAAISVRLFTPVSLEVGMAIILELPGFEGSSVSAFDVTSSPVGSVRASSWNNVSQVVKMRVRSHVEAGKDVNITIASAVGIVLDSRGVGPDSISMYIEDFLNQSTPVSILPQLVGQIVAVVSFSNPEVGKATGFSATITPRMSLATGDNITISFGLVIIAQCIDFH